MSIYDQISRGVPPIGRDLPQIAQMNEQHSSFVGFEVMIEGMSAAPAL